MTSDLAAAEDAARKHLSGAIRRYYLKGLETGVVGVTITAPLTIDELERAIGEAQDTYRDKVAANVSAALDAQIDKLAKWIMANVPGEPRQSQGAVDTAIRIMAESRARIEVLEAALRIIAEDFAEPYSARRARAVLTPEPVKEATE